MPIPNGGSLGTSDKTFAFYMTVLMALFYKPGYLKDSNAAEHSVDSDIFYAVINLSAPSKSYIITFIS